MWRNCLAIVLLLAYVNGTSAMADPSFGAFDQKAKAGERLSVVFFGASLTWGANASDPNHTSYRALTADRLRAQYPEAHFRFWDAAIGGTNSQLGVFRLDRDVLSRKPDLVFVDFSANDDIYSADAERLASYEAIVRRLVAVCPVVQVIFPFKWNVAQGNTDGMKLRDAHLAIGNAYNAPVGDAIALAIERVKTGETTLEKIWPVDGVHPCDEGYELFADAAWQAFENAVRTKQTCRTPGKMLHANTYYIRTVRLRLATLKSLPAGWRAGKPNVVAAYFDFLMSRWQDDQAIASNRRTPRSKKGRALEKVAQKVEPLQVQFRGQTVLLFGETTQKSGKYRVFLDGQLLQLVVPPAKEATSELDAGAFARRIKGNGHYVQVLATGLHPRPHHTLRIEPLFSDTDEQELRIESVCVAGE